MGKEVGKEEGKGNGAGCSQRESVCTGSFVLALFISLLQAGILGEVSGKGFIIFPGVLFLVMVSNDWSVTGKGVFSHCSWFWCHPPVFSAFLTLELK